MQNFRGQTAGQTQLAEYLRCRNGRMADYSGPARTAGSNNEF